MKDGASKKDLGVETAKWEVRFAGKDGLPRYDYPGKGQ